MIVHNLTDHSVPYRPTRKARALRVAGTDIEPGKNANIPDHRLQPSDIAGWITANEVSIDGLPEWYQEARRKKMDRKPAVVPVPDPEPEKEGKQVEVDVGSMTATVKPGLDGELGTEDDEVSIKPKPRFKKKGRGK